MIAVMAVVDKDELIAFADGGKRDTTGHTDNHCHLYQRGSLTQPPMLIGSVTAIDSGTS